MAFRIEKCLMMLPGRKIAKGALETDGAFITKLEFDGSVKPEFLVIPGLVNAHGHTAMTLVRGLGGGLPLKRWLEEAIFPVEAKMKPEHVAVGVEAGALEMVMSGTTLVADMYDFPADGEKAFATVGMKANTCRVGLSFVPGRAAECIGFTSDVSADKIYSGLIKRDFAVHSEYLTDEEFCRKLAAANRVLKKPVHFHVSETLREHKECIARHGKTPIEFLASTGLLDHGGYAAHCVHATDGDFEIMREKGVSIVHNPTSNLKLGSGIARIRRAIDLGVNVALGTDGCASNDDLDMFEEMRLAALLASGASNDPCALSAWDVLEMATVNGARALGRFDTGRIEVGARADLAILGLDSLRFSPLIDVANAVVYSAHASDVIMTMVDGKIVYDRCSFVFPQGLKERFERAVAEIGICSLK